ncbi:MAG TPA: 50S ribosomal protein L34e [Candidatus Nanoarchaeia archaeon]|nr:50S ribosomal protein L34e [Candidatus Nanoarchaeia archaeon]
MTEPRLRSRSFRKVYVRTPGGRTTIHYTDRKPQIAHCAECGNPLKGFLRLPPSKVRNVPKSKKRPERPYPYLCSKCMRKKIVAEVGKNV